MKKLSIAACLALLSSSALAAEGTCASPNGPITPGGGPYTGSTCASDSNLKSLCAGGLVVAGPQSVYTMVVGAGNTGLSITVTPTDNVYDTAVYVEGPDAAPSQANCEGNDACDAFGTNDANGAGAAETVSPGAAVGAGTYYVIISSTKTATGNSTTPPAASAGCGGFSMTLSGTLPVKLQNFSVD